MKKLILFIGLIIELVILVGLLWKHTELYDLEVTFYWLLISPFLMICHWFLLKKEHNKKRFSRSIQLKLFFFTGPSIILCLSLILSINYELNRVQLVGGATKEMELSLIKEGYPDNFQQWTKYSVKKMKSDQLLYAMLLGASCLLYGSRYFSGKEEQLYQEKHKIVAIESKSDVEATNKDIIS